MCVCVCVCVCVCPGGWGVLGFAFGLRLGLAFGLVLSTRGEVRVRASVCKSVQFVTAAGKGWGLSFGVVPTSRERAQRAKEHASRTGEHGIIKLLHPHCVSVI